MPYGKKVGRVRRHRTRHRVVHHKRRRMGAVSERGGLLMTLVGASVGGIVAKFIGDKLASFLPATWDTKTIGLVRGLAMAAGGGFIAWKFRNPLIKGAGIGIAVEGVHTAAQAYGLISGVGRLDPGSLVFPRGAKVGNYYNVRTINGGTDFPKPGTVGAHRRPAVSVMGGM